MAVNFKYKFNALKSVGLKYYLSEEQKFLGQCPNIESQPECCLVVVPNKPPYPKKDQFCYHWRVLETDHKNYAIVQSCLDVDFMGLKIQSDSLMILTRDQKVSEAELENLVKKQRAILKGIGMDPAKYEVIKYNQDEEDCKS